MEKEINLEFVIPMRNYTWWINDDIIIEVKNAESHEEAFKTFNKFIMDMKTKKINFEKGNEVFMPLIQ